MHKGRICEEIASGTEWNEMNIVYERKEKSNQHFVYFILQRLHLLEKRGNT